MKLLVSDYDGTLFTDEKELVKNIEKIKDFRKEGNLFAIATGRVYENFIQKTHLHNIPFDYLILGNGTTIIDNQLRLVQKTTIDSQIIPKVLKEIKKYHSISDYFLFSTWGEKLSKINNHISKIHCIAKDYSQTNLIYEEIKRLFPELNIYISTNKYINIEIISRETNKAKAITFLAEKEKLENKDIYVIGNAANDIEMIKEFGGYGMSNSEKSVLDITNKLYNSVYDLIADLMLE